MDNKEKPDAAAATDVLTLEYDEKLFEFRNPKKPHINRYLKTVAASGNMLGGAEMLVRDCATPESLTRLEATAKRKPGIWQAFSNAILAECGITDEVTVSKNSNRRALN